MRTVYLDHNATTPLDPEVYKVMEPFIVENFYNPSSVYSRSRKVREKVEEARAKVASLLNASPEEIIFTSGGTEANNQAIIGGAKANAGKGRHIITSAAEHHAVLDTCLRMEKEGFEVTVLPVDEYGRVLPETLEKAIRTETVLVSIMYANNEVGTINDIKTLAEIAHKNGSLFHTDAVQAAGKIKVDVKDLGVDMLSVSAHKLYGPKGIGCLYVKKGTKIESLLTGGGQENKMRAGTENVPAIIGFGRAAELTIERGTELENHIKDLEKILREGIKERIPDIIFTGHPEERIPGCVSVCFKYIEGESMLLLLDQRGIMASSGSACSSKSLKASHVLLAMGISHEIAHGSLRLSLGKDNRMEDVEYLLEVLPPIVEKLRLISPLYQGGR
ncbi:cysteine desulfurase NifS [Thermosyntropha sp.]|uniref:cysteine desulfurase NifS n=1 Tax=Thermosyntropha sp. TaxID=2740820 RepID=UPI0025D6A61A|nr:cysteine desulfurase NifS [Thermosyntropha sp.]MBO8159580.1 cysteine desulfurase NifS [Thermosyntropha sp.]